MAALASDVEKVTLNESSGEDEPTEATLQPGTEGATAGAKKKKKKKKKAASVAADGQPATTGQVAPAAAPAAEASKESGEAGKEQDAENDDELDEPGAADQSG